MSWHFSQALVEEYSAGISSAGEQSALSSTTPMPEAYFWPDKTTEHSRLSQFGMMSEPLTEHRGEAMLTSFLEDFPAKTSARPARGLGSTANVADCGPKWHGSFARFDLDTSTWKTPQCSLLGDLDEFSETWPAWGSMRSGECWALTTPMLRTREKESGFLPTPDASMGARGASTNKTNRRADGSKRQVTINDIVGGRPNPAWTEWVMGWPIGWTDLRPLETGRFQEWLKLHGRY